MNFKKKYVSKRFHFFVIKLISTNLENNPKFTHEKYQDKNKF